MLIQFSGLLGCDELFRNNYGRDNFSDNRGPSSPINVGEEYDVKIEDVGRDGDGIARIEGYVVFVSGAKLGDEVKIKINSTRRNFGFADIVE
jgi:predicted RNA-binding protein with TRAM domain